MISRKTIYSLLVSLLVGVGVFAWNGQKRDECDLAGGSRGTTEVVIGQEGRKQVLASCSDWLPRQPHWVQGAVFFDVAAWVVFGLSMAWDMKRTAEEKRMLRGRLGW